MSEDQDDHNETTLQEDLSETVRSIRSIVRRLPGARRAIDFLTGVKVASYGFAGAGAQALEARLNLYRTDRLVEEAQKVADATGYPVPIVFNSLVRQRRIDEFTIDALRRIKENSNLKDEAEATDGQDDRNTSDRWFHTFYEEAGMVDEEYVREAFVRLLAGEIQSPGTFSLRTLRIVGSLGSTTAHHFRRAASVSVRFFPDRKHITDARIPSVGGELGQNFLQGDGLSFDVLMDLTENDLLHPDYRCYHPYGPFELSSHSEAQDQHFVTVPFLHQDATWILLPSGDGSKVRPMDVHGAKLTSCGVELLEIVDIEPLPDFTTKLVEYFRQAGYRMVPVR